MREWYRTIKVSALDSFLGGLFERGYTVRFKYLPKGKVRVWYW